MFHVLVGDGESVFQILDFIILLVEPLAEALILLGQVLLNLSKFR